MKKLRIPGLKERGQSMVELALFITILMALLAGTVDLGRGFFTWLAMRDAAQEAATYGAINPPGGNVTCTPLSAPYPQICQRAYDNLNQVLNNSSTQVIVLVTLPDGASCLGHTIQVDIEDPTFPLTVPFLGTIIGSDTITIHATINDTILTPSCH